MNEQHVDITTADGSMSTFTCWPDGDGNGDGPYPVIVFYMDAPAVREELYDMARRKAEAGYYVILPDLFYRFGIIRFPFRDANTRVIWGACMANLSNAQVMDDTRALLDFLKDEPAAKDGPMASIGYCMSGRFVTAAAATYPDVFVANASLYGVGIVTSKDDSAHFGVPDITGEMYYAFAETDGTVPDYVIPTLKSRLEEHGTDHVLEVFPGTEHGFSFPSRDVYNEAAAEKAHAHFMDMCARRLGD